MKDQPERDVFNRIESLFSPSEAKVSLNLPIRTRTGVLRSADIAIEHREWGLYIIEIKAYTAQSLRRRGDDARSAYEQASTLAIELSLQLRFDRNLKSALYNNQIRALVAFPNISIEEWYQFSRDAERLPTEAVIFREDLESVEFGVQSAESSRLLYKLQHAPIVPEAFLEAIWEFTPRPKKKHHVFISYRRQDSSWAAGRLSDYLKRELNDDDVFIDVRNIRPGRRFKQVIEERIRSSSILLAVIGRDWLTISHPDSGKRRLDDEIDFVRWEIETALGEKLEVIPVLVDDARMPHQSHLPPSIKELSELNACSLRAQDFNEDAQRLSGHIKQILLEAGVVI